MGSTTSVLSVLSHLRDRIKEAATITLSATSRFHFLFVLPAAG
jgi:hypothetical protein